MESGRDGAVQILFPDYMDFVDYLTLQKQRQFYGDVEGIEVHRKGRAVIHLVGADVLAAEEVDDLLFGLELHQGSAVVFTEFG